VNEELLRAIRTESAEAIKHWFGVGARVVWNWRKAFGVGKWETQGSRRLHRALSEAGAEVTRGRRLSSKQIEQRRRRAIKLNLGRYLKPGYYGPWWTKKEIALLGKFPDEKVAKRIGRPVNGVRIMRTRLGISSVNGRRQKRWS
jgi:hypothetical protein